MISASYEALDTELKKTKKELEMKTKIIETLVATGQVSKPVLKQITKLVKSNDA